MIHGRIVIDSERCKGCALCVGVCPRDVIHMSDAFNTRGYHPAQLVDPPQACTGCAVCALICPDVAITVYRQANQDPRTGTRKVNREPEDDAISQSGTARVVFGSAERRV